jgi:serine/threonine protein kinase
VKVAIGTDRSKEDIETERKIYRRFGRTLPKYDSFILLCLEPDNPRGLVFEKCEESVRSWLSSRPSVTFEDVLELAKQGAKGLAFVHDCVVIQGDG